jgi:glycosyltransferase involved in cell wall biosynthesis
MTPTVTVVIPCFRGEHYLPYAIESCLMQDYAALEVIVVDDASPDRCGEIAQEYASRDPRVRVIRLPQNGGVSRAFNAGYQAAQGAYLTRLAQDDLFHPQAIRTLVEHLELHPAAGLVYADEERFEEGRPPVISRKPAPAHVLAEGNKLGLCALWRRTVWETVGPLDPAYDTVEDYEYWLRVARAFPLTHCPAGPLLKVRYHPEMGSKRRAARQELLTARLRLRHRPHSLAQRRRILAEAHFEAAWHYRETGARAAALLHHLLALWHAPTDGRCYRSLAALILGFHPRSASRSPERLGRLS